ncbi:MAG: thymidine phosphorylase [Clostridia bacterium]|nr:thymidine phosphorylase [Clostridia bacterium]
MRTVDIISKKRNGGANTEAEIKFLTDGFVSGAVADYQMSAWLMAVCLKGMNHEETQILTRAMIDSGEVLDLSTIKCKKADKHSTGGVGDTTTLILAPLVAACGGCVAKLSGRGLGATGGTIDKLESIKGLSTECDGQFFEKTVGELGLCVASQSASLVPADKLMYALRDVTATVDSIPLIASSIMSKKIAAGADVIVLDVKFGNGAFMKTVEEAEALAWEMVNIGHRMGRETMAILTNMNEPLGMAIGNGLEVREAIDALSLRVGNDTPLMQVSTFIAKQMLMLSGVAGDGAEADALVGEALHSGRALEKLRSMCAALGGDTSCFDNLDELVNVKKHIPVYCGEGYIKQVDALSIGNAACILGAGRQKKTDKIDHAVGLMLHKRVGDHVKNNEPVATLYVNDETKAEEAANLVKTAFVLSNEEIEVKSPIYKIVRKV